MIDTLDPISQGGVADDPFFAQFDPANASANTGIFGGGGMPTITNPGISGPYIGGGLTSDGTAGARPGIDDFERAWMSSPGSGTLDDLRNFVAQHPEYGVTLGGSKGDKVYGPNGDFWADAVISAGLGGTGKTFDRGTGGAAGMGAMGSLLAPYTDQYKLPTQAELEAMPGYQAAQAAAQRAVQTGAAAKGTLLTGGTQKALQQTAGDVASQMYGQLAGLNLNAMGFNRDSFYRNEDGPFSKLYQTAQLGSNAASQPTVSTTSSYQPMSKLYEKYSPLGLKS